MLWLTTNRLTTWWIRTVARRIDPWLFKASNGRFFSMGAPSMPMLTITTIGRRSGKPRAVHLACVEDQGDPLIVASAMGQQRHPGWSYNLDAHPEVAVQMPGERFTARAAVLTDSEKEEVWDDIRDAIPQIRIYESRTDRNIRVYRLRRVSAVEEGAGSERTRVSGSG